MGDDLLDWVEEETGQRPSGQAALSGGCVASLRRLSMPGGDLVAKEGSADSMTLEGRMLTYLAEHSSLPVPRVIAGEDGRLLMSWIENGGGLDQVGDVQAAEILAALHSVSAPRYGFDYDTVIGGIPQPNGWMESWVDFFRERRLLYMADLCLEAGQIDATERARFDALAARLEDIIGEPSPSGLIHGDLWGGNVLAHNGRVAGFVDPAIYFADPEIELAFSTLFSTFGDYFYRRYDELRPIRAGFSEERRDLYNLWHLLNHVYLFGRGYWGQTERILQKFGC